ncbi:protein of unknown function DUF3358 [Cynara cardunculus var. scolymus]|uniref:Aminopeptidase n=1 Tax=Cynara cardunculus var. scolymus TaxID=59895 RepID=A0A124SGC0_CYNCS|nr:protein of unknown function DUF3358 [Cynara cardunculus var. scolymus]
MNTMKQNESQKMDHFKGQNRLPKFAIPHRYDLTLKPNLELCNFSGSVLVDVSILDTTRFLVLNSIDLVIHESSFTNSNNDKVVPSEVVVDNDGETIVLVFDEPLSIGDGVLEINFDGVLNEHMKGFYKGTYVDGGVRKNMAVTQFEPADARRCFPCWDEPALKATFKITVDNVPSELTALSNMPVSKETINGNFKSLCFEESPIMPTYLVAVVIGVFDYIEETTHDGTRVRAYCPVGKSEKAKLALSISVKALELYTKYFSMPYALPKLDMVAVPDFSGGAMENYGLITYRETELLHDDLHSAAANTQRLSVVVTHEVGHQWFGNLVTMEWWTHLWLNEGFATWVSYLATDILFPEWRIWTQFLEVTAGGLRIDSLEQSHPVEVEVHNASSVLEVFDAISYKKGSSLVRMLKEYLGDEIFQKYACKNARTEDLWSVLSDESGVEVNKLMDIWTKQTGYPVIYVKSEDYTLEFEQTRFMSLGLQGEGQWIVPITLSVGSYSNRKTFLLETKIGKLDISELYGSYTSSHQNSDKNEEVPEKPWVKVNVGHTGFYRVKYDSALTARLRKAIEEKWLSPEDKFGILDDTYALCEAGEESISSLLSLMDLFREDLDYLTYQLFTALATFGHRKTHEELKKRFQIYIKDKNTSLFPVDIRKIREQDTVYVTARISMEARETAWIWLKENWDAIIKRWGQGMVFHHFIRDIVTPFSTDEMAEEVEEFFRSRVTPAFVRNLKQSIEQIRIKAKWIEKVKKEESVIIPKLARGLTRSPITTVPKGVTI